MSPKSQTTTAGRWKEAVRKEPLRSRFLLRTALAVSLLALTGGALHCFLGSAPCSPLSFILTPDQQGRVLFRRGEYQEAARRFTDPAWQATALYRAGEFKDAAAAYGRLTSAEALYNRGTALIMLGQYEDAVAAFDRALALRPDWPAALANRDIAVARAELVKQEGGNMTDGMLGADEISFTRKDSRQDQPEETFESAEQSPAEMRAIWLRQVQTKPGDFLKAKFAYQSAMNTNTLEKP